MAIIGLLLVIAAQVMHQASLDQDRPADAIVVFGAAEYVGHPSPVFRARLDHARELFQRGLAPLIITTGGAGNDPKFSEGQVGRDYLAKRGVPDVNLIAETQGTDTEHSARRVAVIMDANNLKSALVVSDAYHLYRARAHDGSRRHRGVHLAAARFDTENTPRTLAGGAARGRELSAVSAAYDVESHQLSAVSCQLSAVGSWRLAFSS